MGVFHHVLKKIWGDRNPYNNFPTGLYPDSRKELGHGPHPFLLSAISDCNAKIVVEIGVWKGASSIAMADFIRKSGRDACVIAVDTWLGSSEHWHSSNNWHESLNCEFGQPMLMRTFMNNVILSNNALTIVPLPLDSTNANVLLRELNLGGIDVVHIDAGHDYRSVMADLEMWWPLVSSGGFLIGDDYLHTGDWPAVRQAFDEFFGKVGLAPFEFGGNKCRIRKPIIHH